MPGSAAEIERVWSQGELILRKARRGMTPLLFETLLFLKFNKRFWDLALVSKAVKMIKAERANARLEKEQVQMALDDDDYE
jgi:hypothetical protein